MKTHQISSIQLASRHDTRASREFRDLPLTDYSFQSSTEIHGGIRALPKKGNNVSILRKFRQLSAEFLGAETSRDYVAEIIFFTLIAGVSAWPIITMIAALARMLK